MYDTNYPRRIKAKHLDDLIDYDSKPLLIAHLSYEFLCETVIKFDEMHRSNVKKECYNHRLTKISRVWISQTHKTNISLRQWVN